MSYCTQPVLLIFSIDFLFSISSTSALIVLLFFLVLDLDLICSSFFLFPMVAAYMIDVRYSFLMYVFNAMHFLLNTTLAASHTF